MDRTRTDLPCRPWAAAPASDSFADILAASAIVNHDNGAEIDLGGGSKLRLENVHLAQLAAGFDWGRSTAEPNPRAWSD
jgi:hypothetical protein